MTLQNEISKEMQQVSAYPTKQKMHQKHVALFDDQADENAAQQTRASEEPKP